MDYLPPPRSLPPGSIVWAYCRDSGGADQEQSVQQQVDELNAYCQKYGLVLARTFADEAKSGKSTKNRDDFQVMMDAITAQNHPTGLLVWNLSRLARNYDDAVYSMSHLRRHHVVIHSLTETMMDNLEGRLLESVNHYKNAKYIDDNAKQIKRALEANVKNGYTSGGFPCRGYLTQQEIIGKHRDGKPRIASRLIPDPELFPLAKLAWKMRAEGKSVSEITKATGGKLYKSAGSWTTFFNNRTYLGIGRCGDLEVPNHHEAAVSLEDWEKVQSIRSDRYSRMRGMSNPHRVRNPTLLSGLAFCKFCGAALVAHRGYTKNYPYYRCGKRDRERGIATCPAKGIHQSKANKAVMEYLDQVVLTPAFLEEVLEEACAQLTDKETLSNEIKRKRTTLVETNRAINNLLELAETFGSGAAAQRLKERETERAILEGEIKVLQERQENLDITLSPEAIELTVATWRGEFDELKAAGNTAGLRSFLARFIARIEIGYNSDLGQHEIVLYRVWAQNLLILSHVNVVSRSTENLP